MHIEEYADRDMLYMGLASRLASELDGALRQRDEVLFVVPGGTTPGPVFDTLSEIELDWKRVRVLLSDERWVDETSDRSNTRLVRDHLLRARAAEAGYLPLYAPAERPEDVLDELAAPIEALLPVSVLLLGMGADMHTASLFPGAEGLEVALSPEAPVLVPVRAGSADEARISLTAPVLNDALAKHIVITGDAKRAALERARSLGDPLVAPVAAVLDGATVHWAP